MKPNPKKPSSTNDLMRYAGLATQLFAMLALAVFAGYKGDDWLNTPIPLLVWVLPLLFLGITIFKLIKDTSKKKKGS
jgi:hypothetical protein